MSKYYIYFHINPKTKEPFYVGQGTHTKNSKNEKFSRAYSIRSRSNFWKNIYNKYGVEVQIIETNVDECVINEKEIFYIKKIGRRNLGLGPLVNLTDGGEGTKGNILSNETKKKIGNRHYPSGKDHILFGKNRSDDIKEKIKKSLLGVKFTKERKEKLKQSRIGKIPPMTGKGYLLTGSKNGRFGKSLPKETMKRIGKLGTESRKRKNFEKYSSKIKELHLSGLSINQIKKELKISYNLIKRILSEIFK